MGVLRILSLLCLALTVSLTVSQDATPAHTSQTVMVVNFYINNLMFKDASDSLVRKMLSMVTEKAGGKVETMHLSDGLPCTKVFVEFRDIDQGIANAFFPALKSSGVEIDGKKYDIGFNGCEKNKPPPKNIIQIEFYIKNSTWDRRLDMKDSGPYMLMKAVLGEYFSALQGEMIVLRFFENFGCTGVFMQYDTANPSQLFVVMANLKQGLYLDGKKFDISTDACLPDIDDKNQCPKPTKQYFTTCNDTCDDKNPCADGFKCCYNGCGDSCVRVGYVMALHGGIVIDMPWDLNLMMKDSEQYKKVVNLLKNMIATQFGNMLHALDINRFDHFNNEDTSNATKAMMTLYFKEDFSNAEIYDKVMKVMKSVLPMGASAYKIVGFKLGMEGICGKSECHNLCKHLITGDAYCSCDEGRIGSECKIFDCRMDVTSHIPDLSKNYCRGQGQCVKNDDDRDEEYEHEKNKPVTPTHDSGSPTGNVMGPRPRYACECQEPYFGETCQYQLCDFLVSPCNGHGKCVGRHDTGKMCECDAGWGGLYCEINKPDPAMSKCEIKKRLMDFVHRQVTGEEDLLDSMIIPMKSLLKKMGFPYYEEIYCLPSDAEVPGSFYSQCIHNSWNGKKEMCHCLNSDGSENESLFYFKKDDCRGFAGKPVEFTETIYIQATPWNSEMADMSSDEYMNVFNQVSDALEYAGGGLKHLTLMPRGVNCLAMKGVMVLDETAIGGFKELVPSLKLQIGGAPRGLSIEPCKEEVDINSCPHVNKGDVSICMYECNPNGIGQQCPNGKSCCPLACGGGRCIELGYLHKVIISITISYPYHPDYNDTSSQESIILLGQLENQLLTFMAGRELPGYESLDVVGIVRAHEDNYYKNASASNSSWGDGGIAFADRRKRQAEPTYTTIIIQLKFSQEIDADIMNDLKNDMLSEYLQIDNQPHNVLSVSFGGDDCRYMGCYGDAICVGEYGGNKKCACPKGRSGPTCTLTNCFDDDGKSMCMNGGTCERNYYNYKSTYCKCQEGFGGEMCQVDYCSYYNPGACNKGVCKFEEKLMKLCDCPEGTGGLFCELSYADNLTMCETLSRLTHYVVDTLTGKRNDSKLKIPISQFLMEAGLSGGELNVPTCWDHGPNHYGEFKYFCEHNIKTGEKMGECRCVNGNGQPNYWTFEDGECIIHSVRTACSSNPCYSNGTCVPLGRYDYYCRCPYGLEGKRCEKRQFSCPNEMMPLKSKTGYTRSCRGQACPFGFECHNYGNDSNCCFDPHFLCKLEGLCQNGATCIGGVTNATICDCPDGKDGLFCEKDYDGVKLTNCQRRQRFLNWVIDLLRKERPMPSNFSISELQTILKYIGMEYIMTDFCDDSGSTKSKVTVLNIFNLTESKEVCLDYYGEVDETCHAEVCKMMDAFEICQNGGNCVGKVKEQLCDCSQTGFHGPLCEMPGKGQAETQCTNARMIAKFALQAMNLSSGTGDMIKQILMKFDFDEIFVPECDHNGFFMGSGCAFGLNGTNHKMCYCANVKGERVGNKTSWDRPPKHCPHDGGQPGGESQCPKEWGPDCKKPDSWCSKDVKCDKGEKCYRPIPCNEEGCYPDMRESHCVPDEIELPCDPKPCPHKPYGKCMPCGDKGHCVPVKKGKKGKGNTESGMGYKDKYDEKEKGKWDDNDSAEKEKYDDNDSYDKDKYNDDKYDDDDDDDLEKIKEALMGKKMRGDENYICKCPRGWSGKHCEINDEVCAYVPSDLCSHGCIGDLESGFLCRCPEGFSGLLCNKPASTMCQIQKEFFDDAIAILKGEMKDSKYNTERYRSLVKYLVKFDGGEIIPIRKCSKDGLYDRLQCNFVVSTMKEDQCHCVDRHGEYVSSNIQPYIDFPVCTGPTDPREGMTLCQIPGFCLNGGRCVFDIYQGKLCECTEKFHGLFCQHPVVEPEPEPISFCNYVEDSFLTAQSIIKNESTAWLGKALYPQVYLNITWAAIGTDNRDIRGLPRNMAGMKAECNEDGTFKPFICDRNLVTSAPLACYCTNSKGIIFSSKADNIESLKCEPYETICDEIEERCPKLHCKHGHRMDLHRCPVCECRHPCEGVICPEDERCVVRHHKDCDEEMEKMGCEKPVCVPKRKPGMCPGHESSTYGSIIGGGLSRKDKNDKGSVSDKPGGPKPDKPAGETDMPDKEKPIMDNYPSLEDMQCKIECADDADCEGKAKCCGLCGNRCVDPIVPETCLERSELLKKKMNLVLEIQKGDHLNMSRSLYMTLFHLAKTKDVWIPTCIGDLYNPAQCKYSVAKWRDENKREATECFCVDRLGNPIRGSKADSASDQFSCQIKPLSCPAPNPMQEGRFAEYDDKCKEDMDCAMNDKCCSDGLRNVCSKPADPMKASSTLDMMMENLCQLASDACSLGSTCSGKWKSSGKSCDCPSNRKGPFCEVPKLASDKDMTVCQRKRFALERFNESIIDYHMKELRGVKPEKLEGILEVIEKLYNSWSDEEKEEKYERMSMIYYKCDEEGHFYSMQCSLNMHTGKKEACFCVDKEGIELLGTRKHIRDGMPYCGGKEPSCKIGTPLRNYKGEVATCGRGNGCPGEGYMCVRGMYGKLHCCPTGYETDVCMLPSDVGSQCKEKLSNPVTRYAYNWFKKSCEAFEYRGCDGNKNNFMTMDDCKNRCIDKVYQGKCPAVFRISKNKDCDKNTCKADGDCPNDRFKCCQSTCGKHCVPSVHENPKEGMCPFGYNKGEECMKDEQCGKEQFCHVRPGGEVGFCCVNVDAANLCHIKPWMAMGMTDDDDDKKHDKSYDGDDNDSADKDKNKDGDDNDSAEKHKDKNKDGDDNDSAEKHKDKNKDGDDNDSAEKHKDKSKDEDDNDSAEKKMKNEMMCKEKKERYFYNPKTHKCQKTFVCKDMDFNSFRTMQACCETCGSGTRCKAGKCPKVEAGIYMVCKNECRSDSDCRGNSICCYNGCGMTCKLPVSETGEGGVSECQIAQAKAKRAKSTTGLTDCAINFVPSCDPRTKMYSRQQCQHSLGTCWCVTNKGNYIPQTMTHGPAQCDGIKKLVMEIADQNPQNLSSVEFDVCTNKSVHCCKADLCLKTCRAHPEAMCRVNPCGGCKAEYFYADGTQVEDCDEGFTGKCHKEQRKAATHALEAKITAYHNRKPEEMNGNDKMDTKQYIDDLEQSSIIRKEIPLTCQQRPSTGFCKGFAKRWFYDSETRSCSMFIWGMCGGNENRFLTPEDCFAACDPSANPCATTQCGTSNPRCTLLYSPDCYMDDKLCDVRSACTSNTDPDINKVKGIFVPKCLPSGDYNLKQRHGHYSWCVDSQGKYNGGLTSGEMECTYNGPRKDFVIQTTSCLDGSKPRPKCMNACTNKVCAGHPDARCQVDLCSDNCATKFVDEQSSEEVSCEDESCKVFRFDSDEYDGKCNSSVLCDGKGVKSCPRDVCENAAAVECPKNPCAVCMVDPCTCKPYFVDALTRKRLNDKKCRYVTKGACHLKTCSMMKEMEGTTAGGIDIKEIDFPECKKNGKFEPKQCASTSDCYCVGEDGVKIGEVSANGKCNAIKETKKLDVTLSFKGDFNTLKKDTNKLERFKRGIMDYFVEKLGIPADRIKIGEPYQGSIKVDVEIIPENNISEDVTDLSVVQNNLNQAIETGNVVVDLGDEQLTADPSASTIVAIKDDDGDNGDKDNPVDDGLSDKDKIIIGAASGAAALAFIVLIAYCCCCSRKKPEPVDDTFTHERQSKTTENIYDNPDMTFKNKGYMPEQDPYMKVRM